MTESEKAQLEKLTYIIDLDCFQEVARSFAAVAEQCLCPACRGRLATSICVLQTDLLLQYIRDCCSKRPDFMSPKQPLLEKIFRVFLIGGNEPLTLGELAARLATCCDGSISPSLQMLRRLLDSDRHYGFKPKTRLTAR